MRGVFHRMMQRLGDQPRLVKRGLMIGFDLVAIVFAVYLAILIPFDQTPEGEAKVHALWWLMVVMPLVSVPIFASFKLYRAVIRYLGPHFAFTMFWSISISAMVMACFGLWWRSMDNAFALTSILIYWMLTALLIGGSRLLVRGYYRTRSNIQKKPVVVYGAGQAGARLVSALVHGNEFHPRVLIDDNPELWGNDIRGVRIMPPSKLPGLVSNLAITEVLLALPSVSRSRRLEIVESLRQLSVNVSTIPGLLELVSGSAKFDEVRPIQIEDLLGREPVEPDEPLLRKCITGKSVLVTGAGGSIGSELSRQILQLKPARLVLVDLAEHNLYRIEQSLRKDIERDGIEVELTSLLGNVLDQDRMQEISHLYKVQTIYHAAAYKHVPIVEYNLAEGVRNNTLGTWSMAKAALAEGVENFVLISTDKAVRPTNAMGATKRMAELVLQGLSTPESPTRFCMVRFGNVLDSSGSVVPLFREQIKSGGPVTVTHPEIVRYFMTIPEAAQLVLQAGSMGTGGDVFVLDMGEPVRIADLAKTMIRLAGLQEKTDDHPGGDIGIEYTKLRPGEKLYEELHIGSAITGTEHRQILRASEDALAQEHLEQAMSGLIEAVKSMDCDKIMAILREHVHGYKPANDLVDLAWLRKREVESQDSLPFKPPVIETNALPDSPAASFEDASDSVS